MGEDRHAMKATVPRDHRSAAASGDRAAGAARGVVRHRLGRCAERERGASSCASATGRSPTGRLRQRRFQLRVSLPPGETTVRVVTVDRNGRRQPRHGRARVRAAARRAAPVVRGATYRPDPRARRSGGSPGASAAQRDLRPEPGDRGRRRLERAAQFPAASTLKLAIAVSRSHATEETPRAGSTLDRLLRQMLIVSDNRTANTVLSGIRRLDVRRLGGTSTR